MSSSNIAIKVENISKLYRIGSKEKIRDNFAATIFEFIKSPLKNYREYRSLYKFDDINPDSDSNPSNIIWALRDVSFEVERGDVLGIIGLNGAGKSTLLKILARVTDPTLGRAEIRGKVSSLLEVGTGFHPELTGRENVYLNATVLGMKKKEVDLKFDQIVDFSGVEKFIDTPVKRYSSGMKVRLAFSVAAHLDPEILIIDEVLAVGDIEFQKKCLGKMEQVATEGRTVLFVSHNMPAVQGLCNRGILLKNGKIVCNLPVEQTVNKYLTMIKTSADGQAKQDLATRTDRYGDGGKEIQITNVQFIDPVSFLPVNRIISGQRLLIEMKYRCNINKKVDNIAFSIVFFKPGLGRYFACPSEVNGKTFSIGNGEGRVYCEIPKLPLIAGEFHYHLLIYGGKKTYDNLQNAGKIQVEEGDYYGTGRLPSYRDQTLLIDFDWKH